MGRDKMKTSREDVLSSQPLKKAMLFNSIQNVLGSQREERGERRERDTPGEVKLACKPRAWATYQAQFGN